MQSDLVSNKSIESINISIDIVQNVFKNLEDKIDFQDENRKMTIVRTGTLVERTKRLNGVAPVAGGEIDTTNGLQDYHILLPIPQSEIDLNKDVELTQNLGYEN